VVYDVRYVVVGNPVGDVANGTSNKLRIRKGRSVRTEDRRDANVLVVVPLTENSDVHDYVILAIVEVPDAFVTLFLGHASTGHVSGAQTVALKEDFQFAGVAD